MNTVTIPTFAAVEQAAERLAGIALRTPLLRNTFLDEKLGRRIIIKPEMLQISGSFKFRGAYNRISQLSDRERRSGVVAWSSGNHAQGVAAAARLCGVQARIVMPEDAPTIKLDNTTALGAQIVTYDRYSESREEIAYALADRDGGVIVPSFDDPHIIAGQGTTALEIFQDSAEDNMPDALLVCCGGGGLTAGCVLATEVLSPHTTVFAIEPEGYDDHARSLASGQRESADPSRPSICDALLTPTPGELTFAINASRLGGVLVVTEEEVREAMRYAFRVLKLVVEPGGAVALAALLAGKLDPVYENVAIIMSGGNVDPTLYADTLRAN